MRAEAARATVRLAAVDLHEPKAARRVLEAQQRADVTAPVGVGAAVPKRRATCLAVLRSPLLPERAPRERQARAAAGTCEDEARCVWRRRPAAAAAAVQEESGRRSDGSDAREGDLLRAGGHCALSRPRHLGASEQTWRCDLGIGHWALRAGWHALASGELTCRHQVSDRETDRETDRQTDNLGALRGPAPRRSHFLWQKSTPINRNLPSLFPFPRK